jgi:putative ABC transport system permease protein
MIQLALASLNNRRVTAFLTLLSIALSVALLLSVEKLRRDARASFSSTISGVDLIVGARSGSVQLLLYSVFRIGNATNNISWQSYQDLAQHRDVAWTVPISLGDSHRGFRVLGTNEDYFKYYRFGRKRTLQFEDGGVFTSEVEAVMGAEVARALGYRVGGRIVVAHGAGDISLVKHEDNPFSVVGILAPTGTPVDRTVHVSLAGIEAIHEDWKDGRKDPTAALTFAAKVDRTPTAITAFLVGLKKRTAIFRVQRSINNYREEPLLAILPGVALQELWDVMRIAEDALRIVAFMVVATGMLGMLVVILASLEARRREMAILRSVGATPLHVCGLFVAEAGMLSAAGIVVGTLAHYGLVLLVRPIAQSYAGIEIPLGSLTATDALVLGGVLVAGLFAGLIPALRAYRMSLADGLSIRV